MTERSGNGSGVVSATPESMGAKGGIDIAERCILNCERLASKRAKSVVLTLILAATSAVFGQPGTGNDTAADVTIVLENVRSNAWVVTAVEGDGVEEAEVAEIGVENPVIHLEVGSRYRFVNLGSLTVHPFAIRGDDGEPLLAQRPSDRPFEVDPAVAFHADAEGVTFTLTEPLARAASTYYCTAHPAPLMESGIEIAGQPE